MTIALWVVHCVALVRVRDNFSSWQLEFVTIALRVGENCSIELSVFINELSVFIMELNSTSSTSSWQLLFVA